MLYLPAMSGLAAGAALVLVVELEDEVLVLLSFDAVVVALFEEVLRLHPSARAPSVAMKIAVASQLSFLMNLYLLRLLVGFDYYIGPMPGGPPMPGRPMPPPIGVPGNGGFAVSPRERNSDGSTFFKS